jgi:tRNA(Ser,Leu) C12 N-acetylase TAN1
MGEAVVTCRSLYGEFQTFISLRRLTEGIKVTRTPFRAVLRVRHDEMGSMELAEKLLRECFSDIGRAVPVLEKAQSNLEEIREAAIKVALEHIGEGESFCFRLHKRGAHSLEKPTPKLEYEIGGAVHDALTEKSKTKPKVDLSRPEVTVVGEVLGKESIIGILRREWQS